MNLSCCVVPVGHIQSPVDFVVEKLNSISLFFMAYLNANSSVISSKHDKLVWTLNFYVIEMTSKFSGDSADLIVDSIISANNVLKRTCDYSLFYLIMNVSI